MVRVGHVSGNKRKIVSSCRIEQRLAIPQTPNKAQGERLLKICISLGTNTCVYYSAAGRDCRISRQAHILHKKMRKQVYKSYKTGKALRCCKILDKMDVFVHKCRKA